MGYNIQQADRRLSGNNYAALHEAVQTLYRLGFIDADFDVNAHIDSRHIVRVMENHPELFDDLPAIPEDVRITEGFVFEP